jgi:hypothetical protein
MTDRYTKIVLTVIAGALVYLCVVMTAFPAVQAQSTKRAGEMLNQPIEAVIVGWKASEPMPIATSRPLLVQTERASGVADRVVDGQQPSDAPPRHRLVVGDERGEGHEVSSATRKGSARRTRAPCPGLPFSWSSARAP